MKVFNLRCAQGHGFEGWFGSADDFDTQQARRLIGCPICNSTEVVKAPSAPYIGHGSSAGSGTGGSDSTAGAEATGPARQPAAMPTPAQLQAMFLKMAREVAAHTEDVGERFVEEARRIHYNEVPQRGIRGVASKDEAKALEDEGINVMPLPFGHLLKDVQ